MDGFAILIALVTFVMALLALNKLSKTEVKLAQLKLELGNLAAELTKLRALGPLPAMATSDQVVTAIDDREAPADINREAEASTGPPHTATSVPPDELVLQEEIIEPAAAATAPSVGAPAAVRKPDMEQALASRWFVWIGGVAIAIGGLLFVKYAYDNGLISPPLQVFLGLLIGLVLVGAGEWVRRKASINVQQAQNFVPAALSAAGLAVLFASIYAAFALYQLIGPMTAFSGMGLVGLAAFALSRWQGPFIAALGLVGSYVTPAMIPSAEPSAWGFFPYLVIILVASFATLRDRPWWWLGYAALAGASAWTLLWITGGVFEQADIWPIGLFANLMGLTAFFGLKGPAILKSESGEFSNVAKMTQPLLIGLAGLAAGLLLLMVLVQHTAHDNAALMLLAIACGALVIIAWIKHGLSPLAPVAGLAMAGTLMAWNEAAFHAMTLDEQGVWTWSNAIGPATSRFLRWTLLSGAAFAFAGIANVVTRPSPRSFGLLGGGAAFLFTWAAWARADFLLTDMSWAVIAAGMAALLLAGTFLSNRRIAETEVNLGAGFLAAGSAALLVLALDRLFDRVWLTIAIAVLASVFALGTHVLKPRLMGPISAALASLATLRLFLSRELWLDDRALPLGQHWVIYGYGIPAVLFYVSSRVLRVTGHLRSAIAFEGISLGLVISLVALELRALISGNAIYENPEFIEMAAHILTWLGAAYGLMHRQRLFSSMIALWGARLLILLATLAIIFVSLLALNPVVTEEPVPGNIVFNALLLAYLAPAILIGLLAFRLEAIGWQDFKPVAGGLSLALAFTFVTLQTKRVFQGKIMMIESLSIAESYAYSAVWLLFALGLFVTGIRLGKQYVRMAGLGVMALVVLKVFAWDMSSLEGLFRIASFVGLGLCLVGIGWLYQHFVHQAKPAEA